MPGCSGVTPPAVAAGLADHARRLRGIGYAVAIMDVLGPRGLLSICADAGALARLEHAAANDAKELAAELANDSRIDGGRIAFIGQSFGGSVALRLASRSSGGGFDAVVAYYPWCRDAYGGAAGTSDFATPLLFLAGAEDDWTPVSRCRRLNPVAGSVRPDIVTYRGAVHSFDLVTLEHQKITGVGGTYAVGGNRAATRASQSRYLGFLRRHLR